MTHGGITAKGPHSPSCPDPKSPPTAEVTPAPEPKSPPKIRSSSVQRDEDSFSMSPRTMGGWDDFVDVQSKDQPWNQSPKDKHNHLMTQRSDPQEHRNQERELKVLDEIAPSPKKKAKLENCLLTLTSTARPPNPTATAAIAYEDKGEIRTDIMYNPSGFSALKKNKESHVAAAGAAIVDAGLVDTDNKKDAANKDRAANEDRSAAEEDFVEPVVSETDNWDAYLQQLKHYQATGDILPLTIRGGGGQSSTPEKKICEANTTSKAAKHFQHFPENASPRPRHRGQGLRTLDRHDAGRSKAFNGLVPGTNIFFSGK